MKTDLTDFFGALLSLSSKSRRLADLGGFIVGITGFGSFVESPAWYWSHWDTRFPFSSESTSTTRGCSYSGFSFSVGGQKSFQKRSALFGDGSTSFTGRPGSNGPFEDPEDWSGSFSIARYWIISSSLLDEPELIGDRFCCCCKFFSCSRSTSFCARHSWYLLW